MQRQTIIDFLATKLTRRAMGLVNQMTDEGLYYYFNIYFRNFVADDFEAGKEYFERNIDKIITNTEYEIGWADGSRNPEVTEIFWQQFYNFKMFGIDEFIEMSNNDLENGEWENEQLTHLETLKLIGLEGYDDDSIIYDFVIDNAEEI